MKKCSQDDTNDDGEAVFLGQGGSRSQEEAEVDRDRVAISKESLSDGGEVTRVVHPPRYLKAPGQIKQALESGKIDLDELVDHCIAGINANKAIPCKNGTVVYEPDFPTRLAFIRYVTETVEGLPVKRQEIISRKLSTMDDLEAKLKKSPAARRSLQKLLDKMNKNVSENGAEESED
jgi:hypothetical protein